MSRPTGQTRNALAHRRRAVAALIVLLAIAIAVVVFGSLLKTARIAHRAGTDEAAQAQAEWLIESAIERAARKLADDPGYRGETWNLSAKQLGLPEKGLVVITVETSDDQSNERAVHIRADYPNHPHDRYRRSRQLTIAIPANTGEE